MFEFNGNPRYISDIQTDPFIFQEYLFPRSSGANFNKLPVTILITLNSNPGFNKKLCAPLLLQLSFLCKLVQKI